MEREDNDTTGDQTMTLRVFYAVMRDVFSAIESTARHRVDLHERRLEALELVAKGGVAFEGPFEAGKTYPRGVLVQRHGLWFSLVDGPTKAPGDDHEQWRLVVKEKGGGDDVLRERLERLERRLTLLEGRR